MSDPSGSSQVRPDFVENARRFLTNPKVRSTPLAEQKTFLLGKGVTEAEIEQAIAQIPANQLSANLAALPETVVLSQTAPQHGLMYAAQSALVVGGASYLVYKFVRSWLLPRFFDITDPDDRDRQELRQQLNELQNTTKFVMDTVSQTLESVAAQQEQLARALALVASHNSKDLEIQRIQTDLSVIKSLLLRSDQFPQVPSNGVQNGRNAAKELSGDIPAWQRTEERKTSESDDKDSKTIE